jgi:hypothetical protein
MLTYAASFRRAKSYVKNPSEVVKAHFKAETSAYIDSELLWQYSRGVVSDAQHIANIEAVSDYSNRFASIFVSGKINFGIAQKMLNLYLKYQWCLGNIPEPPHFPVDRIIQEKLIKRARENKIANIKLEPWTQFKDETHYVKVIHLARALVKVDRYIENLSPAEAELKLFDRR